MKLLIWIIGIVLAIVAYPIGSRIAKEKHFSSPDFLGSLFAFAVLAILLAVLWTIATHG